jgi:hypothetical protein
MCDPLSAVAAVGAVASAGASLYEGSQAASELAATNKAQQDANNQWVAYQTRIHNEQAAAEDAARRRATGAQQDTLSKVSPEAQAQTQTTEAERLNTLYNKGGAGQSTDASNPANLLLSGEQSGNQNFMGNLTQQVNQATAAARKRIGALATASSYGGSFGGLGTTVPIAFAQGGNDINLQNAIRQGGLKTYGVQQQVQPINYTVGPGTEGKMSLAKGLGSMAGSLAGFAGPRIIGSGGLNSLGSMFGGGGASTGVGEGFSDSFAVGQPNWSDYNTGAAMGYGF